MRISVAIMHHPARADRIAELTRSCASLTPHIAVDPDPTGPPSPLRTAKLAWAAVDSAATHHLVLQDDVRPPDRFAQQLRWAVANLPDHGIALAVTRQSIPSSHLVRLALAAGSSWAPLSAEWIPVYGLVLPAECARELARYLRGIPDEFRHDDHAITEFCKQRRIPVVATVPNLVDHLDLDSLAGHDVYGARRAAVAVPTASAGEAYWSVDARTVSRLSERALLMPPHNFTVELRNSECRLYLSRPDAGESLSHPFGWYWRDWSALIGVDPDAVLSGYGVFLGDAGAPAGLDRLPQRLAAEVWAAGYLLGDDIAATCGESGCVPTGPVRAELLRAGIGSWIESGLCADDLAGLEPPSRRLLTEVAVAAVGCGRSRWRPAESAVRRR